MPLAYDARSLGPFVLERRSRVLHFLRPDVRRSQVREKSVAEARGQSRYACVRITYLSRSFAPAYGEKSGAEEGEGGGQRKGREENVRMYFFARHCTLSLHNVNIATSSGERRGSLVVFSHSPSFSLSLSLPRYSRIDVARPGQATCTRAVQQWHAISRLSLPTCIRDLLDRSR